MTVVIASLMRRSMVMVFAIRFLRKMTYPEERAFDFGDALAGSLEE